MDVWGFTVKVTDCASGVPIQGAGVVAYADAGQTLELTGLAQTDAAGEAVLVGINVEQGYVRVQREGYVLKDFTVDQSSAGSVVAACLGKMPAPPLPVRNFRVTINDLQNFLPRIRLEWDKIDQAADGLSLQRFHDGDPGFTVLFDRKGPAAHGATVFDDTSGLALASHYRYGIRTYKGTPSDAVLSDYALVEIDTLAPPPAPPPPAAPAPPVWHQPVEVFWVGPIPKVSAAAQGANRLDVFFTDKNEHLIQQYFTGSWHQADLGVRQGNWSVPAPVWSAPSRLDVFYRGQNNQLIQRFWTPAGWSGEVDLGGALTSDPAVVTWGIEQLNVFYRGENNQLVQRTAQPGGGWSGEMPLGGQLAGPPTVASWALDRLDVFYRSPGGHLVQRFWAGSGWSGDVDLGGRPLGAPAVTSRGQYRLDIFYPGTTIGMIAQHSYGP